MNIGYRMEDIRAFFMHRPFLRDRLPDSVFQLLKARTFTCSARVERILRAFMQGYDAVNNPDDPRLLIDADDVAGGRTEKMTLEKINRDVHLWERKKANEDSRRRDYQDAAWRLREVPFPRVSR
jgi:hypothetical protein